MDFNLTYSQYLAVVATRLKTYNNEIQVLTQARQDNVQDDDGGQQKQLQNTNLPPYAFPLNYISIDLAFVNQMLILFSNGLYALCKYKPNLVHAFVQQTHLYKNPLFIIIQLYQRNMLDINGVKYDPKTHLISQQSPLTDADINNIPIIVQALIGLWR